MYEVHDFPEKNHWFYSKLFNRVALVLVHNKWKLEKLSEFFPKLKSKSFYEPNAVDLEEFDITLSKEEARKKLSIPDDKKIVVYTGHLYSWKGADTLAKASEELGEDIKVYFVGGTEKDVTEFRSLNGNICCL